MGFNSNISNVPPAIPSENPPLIDMDNNLLLTLFALLPSDSAGHTTLPSPSDFATHVSADNGILSSEWDFLTSLMPATVTNNPATTSSPPISQGQPSSTDVATGLGTFEHQPLSDANFINFPLVGRRGLNLKDKRTLGVRTFKYFNTNIALMLV